VHREELRVNVVDAEPLEHETGTADVVERPVEQSCDVPRRADKTMDNIIGKIEQVARVVFLRDNDREPLGVRIDRQKGEVLLVLPYLVR
jgi:hypothetical protein